MNYLWDHYRDVSQIQMPYTTLQAKKLIILQKYHKFWKRNRLYSYAIIFKTKFRQHCLTSKNSQLSINSCQEQAFRLSEPFILKQYLSTLS